MHSEEALATFRAETRAWLEANCPPEMRQPVASEDDICWGGRNARFSSEAQRLWLQRMAARGWTVPAWPRDYGGGGLSPEQAKVLAQEMRALGCRPPLSSFGIWMLGPALLKFGTEAQKLEHLPPIARGEIRWCQGYSEPGAGSDLASLQTRAEDRGDHFVVNGQKIWTSYADKADWIFCLVRTDPKASKHTGISFVLFDMASPGVSTRPILLISGKSPFCETFFDNVRVDKRNLVGQAGAGWTVAKYLLTHEREMISAIGDRAAPTPLGRTALEQVGADAQGRLADPLLRAQIAEFEVDEAAFRALLARFGEVARAGQAHPAFSSVLKYYGAELNKRRHELLMAAGGSDVLEWESARSQQGHAARAWLRTKGNSIEGGTSEVQLNVVAKRILELPGA
ncbi:acyl-CoA dehydrogenase family protein [Pseudorhodoferax sp. Leaf265]|uniref:acyl-CoA dehydrogenase family protein n=1 Tax=Pseudorhodoferax sp. Leaf265 TaxID=1736315 RepID=UPI0006FA55FD|nr:acyl-CoA dehydrogenase family protein [Pseudorhodoferax sp. Leaf265]KQP02977.1 acyl-CoA dehydrogenase [Pseudorhodoferax sp. Leaf265]